MNTGTELEEEFIIRKHHLSRARWLTGLALALLLVLLLCAAATAEEPIPIDEAHFGDPEFCKAVSEWIDQENETGYKDGSLDQNEISNGKSCGS